MQQFPMMRFSVSATTREKRPNEVHGKDYYFLSVDEFKEKIQNDEFLEWEEVYKDRFYGTLQKEVERILNDGYVAIFDVDVSVNVHFIPLPLLSYYKNLGYNIDDYPVTYSNFATEISLPIFYDLTTEQKQRVVSAVVKAVESVLIAR